MLQVQISCTSAEAAIDIAHQSAPTSSETLDCVQCANMHWHLVSNLDVRPPFVMVQGPPDLMRTQVTDQTVSERVLRTSAGQSFTVSKVDECQQIECVPHAISSISTLHIPEQGTDTATGPRLSCHLPAGHRSRGADSCCMLLISFSLHTLCHKHALCVPVLCNSPPLLGRAAQSFHLSHFALVRAHIVQGNVHVCLRCSRCWLCWSCHKEAVGQRALAAVPVLISVSFCTPGLVEC
jgi:hypothetical protein